MGNEDSFTWCWLPLSSLLLYVLFSTSALLVTGQLISQSHQVCVTDPSPGVIPSDSANFETVELHPTFSASRNYGSTTFRTVSTVGSGVRASGRDQLDAVKIVSGQTLSEFCIRIAAVVALLSTCLVFSFLLPPRLSFSQTLPTVASTPAPAPHLHTLPPWAGHVGLNVPTDAHFVKGPSASLVQSDVLNTVSLQTLQCLPLGSSRSVWPAQVVTLVLLLCGLLVCLFAELGERLYGLWSGISTSTGSGATPYMIAASHGLPSTLLSLLSVAQLGRTAPQLSNAEVVIDGIDIWEEIMGPKKSSQPT